MSDPDKKKKKKEKEESETRIDTAEAMLDMIIRKEDETKAIVEQAEADAARRIEEAKMDAAEQKRKSVSGEVGADLREKKLAEAHTKAQEIIDESQAEAEEIKKRGEEQIDKAVEIVIRKVLPSME